MAVQTIYLLGTVAVTPNWWGNTQLNGSAPTAANSVFGWVPAKTAVTTPYIRGRLGATTTSTDAAVASSYNAGTTGPAKGTGSGATTAGDSFVVGPFSGTFANTAWTFACNLRASTAGAIGHINMRVWRSANADGSSPTQITANTAGATVTLSTTADTNSSITWSPGQLVLANQYLFFQVEWQETTAGTSNANNVFFRIGTASITTADFVAAATGTLAITQANQTVAAIGTSPAVGTLGLTQAAQILASAGAVTVRGTLALTEISDTLAASGGPRVGGTLALTEISDTLAATGEPVVGGTLFVTETNDTLVATSGSSLWSPSDLGSNLLVWLDASDAASITITGSGVSQWNDKSGYGLTATQGSDASRPVYAGNAVVFSGSQFLAASSAMPVVYDYILVGRPHFPGAYRIAMWGGNGSGLLLDPSDYLGIWSYAGFNWSGMIWPTGADGLVYGSISNTLNAQEALNGSALASAGNPVQDSKIVSLCRNDYGQPFGDFYELILVPYGSSLDTKQKLEGYAAHKWGLAALLPIDHPYKAAPPGAAPLAGITGNLSATQDANTLVAAGGPRVGGTLSANQAAQILAAAGGPRVGGTLAITEIADTLTASGGPRVGGTLALTEIADTLAAAGNVAAAPTTGGLVAHAIGTGRNVATTPARDTTGANLLFLHVATYTSGTVPVLTDNYGNHWNALNSLTSGTIAARTYYAPGDPARLTNVASSLNGGVAAASSTVNSSYSPSYANSGSRDSTKNGGWGVGGGWNDATNAAYPDTFDVTFDAAYPIQEIDVVTLKDNYSVSGLPTLTDTFGQYGIVDFLVQYWDGSAYQTIATVTGNNRVWRQFTFAPITTNKIRISISNALQGYSRLVEVEAWAPQSSTLIVGSGHTVSVAGTDLYGNIEFSAWASSTPVSFGSNTGGAGTAPFGASVITGSGPQELFITTAATSAGDVVSVDQGFQIIDLTPIVANVNFSGAAAYKVYTDSSVTVGPVWTLSGAVSVAATNTTFYGTWISAGTTATLSVTQAAQTLAATGTVPLVVSGTLNRTQAAQTLAATGGVTVRGQLAVSEAADTIVAAGGPRVGGTLTATEVADTIAAAGGPRVGGTLGLTEQLDTIAATGTIPISINNPIITMVS